MFGNKLISTHLKLWVALVQYPLEVVGRVRETQPVPLMLLGPLGYACLTLLSLHDALKHDITSLKTDSISLQLRALE